MICRASELPPQLIQQVEITSRTEWVRAFLRDHIAATDGLINRDLTLSARMLFVGCVVESQHSDDVDFLDRAALCGTWDDNYTWV